MAVNMQETACYDGERPQRIRGYAWVIFALTFGLLLSDYMSRQVLSAVFPQIKAEWGLSDTQLGALSGIVSLAVGILAFPISLAADRWGRVRSVTIMAAIWSIATLLCGLSHNYFTLLSARFLVGVGEAAYASVGMAILIGMFPRTAHLHGGWRIHGGQHGRVGHGDRVWRFTGKPFRLAQCVRWHGGLWHRADPALYDGRQSGADRRRERSINRRRAN